MTNPEPKKRGPKPKPKPAEAVIDAPVVDPGVAAEVAVEAVAEANPAPAAVEAQPEPVAVPMPSIDGAAPSFAASCSIGARHIQYTAHDHITHNDVLHLLEAKRVHIPGHTDPISIAARTITPPKMRPIRVTFTVREPIQS